MVNKICKKCMHENINTANFCNLCGAILEEPSLNVIYPGESKFIETFRSRWSIIWIVIGIVIFLGLFGLATYLLDDFGDFIDLFLSSVGMYGLMLIWILWLRRRNGLSLNVLFGKFSRLKSVRIHYLILMVIAGMGFSISCTYLGIYLIIQLFGEISFIDTLFDGGDVWPKTFDSLQEYLHAVFVVLLLVVVAPIFEEIVFRGIFMTRWVVKWGYKRGIILSSLLFGVLHPGIIGPSVMGLILCCLYNRTKSLWVSVLFHVINNLIVVTLVLITGDPGSIETEEFDSLSSMLPILGLFIVTGCIITFILYKLRPLERDTIPYQHNLRDVQVNNE